MQIHRHCYLLAASIHHVCPNKWLIQSFIDLIVFFYVVHRLLVKLAGQVFAPMSFVTGLLDLTMDEDDGGCFELTTTQKIIAFAVCAFFALFSGVFAVISISLLRIRKFSLLFCIMNIMIFSSIGFLVGFKKQIKSLFQKKRALASVAMIAGIVITMIFSFKWRSLIGVIVGFLIEFVSFLYYALSYIPYGDTLFHKLLF